MEAAPP